MELKLNLANRLKLPAQSLAVIRERVCQKMRWQSEKSYYNAISEVVKPTLEFAQAFASATGISLTRVMDTRYNIYEVIPGEFVALTAHDMRYISEAAKEDATIYDAAIAAAKMQQQQQG